MIDSRTQQQKKVDGINTCAWLDILYGNCTPGDGAIVLIAPAKNSLLGWCELGNSRGLLAVAALAQTCPGCYAKINPMDVAAMTARSRDTGKQVVGNRSEVKSIVSFHLDIDAGKPGYPTRLRTLDALKRMPMPPSMIINSNGNDGGFHVYWILCQPYRIQGEQDREEIQHYAREWNKTYAAAVGQKVDTTSNLDRVLRVPGVPRTDGGAVTLESYNPANCYDIQDFAKDLS